MSLRGLSPFSARQPFRCSWIPPGSWKSCRPPTELSFEPYLPLAYMSEVAVTPRRIPVEYIGGQAGATECILATYDLYCREYPLDPGASPPPPSCSRVAVTQVCGVGAWRGPLSRGAGTPLSPLRDTGPSSPTPSQEQASTHLAGNT